MSHNASKENGRVWKVYIPHKLFTSEKCFLLGFIKEESNLICITSVCDSTEENFVELSKKNPLDVFKPARLSCLGYWHGDHNAYHRNRQNWVPEANPDGPPVWIDMYLSEEGLPVFDLSLYAPNSEQPPVQQATCIIFDAWKVLSSHILCDTGHRALKSSSGDSPDSTSLPMNIDAVVFCLVSQLHQTDPLNWHNSHHVRPLVPQDPRKCTSNSLYYIFTTVLSYMYLILGKLLDNRFMHQHYMELVVNVPAVLHQVKLRYRQVKRSRHMTENDPLCDIRCLNVQTRLIMDTLLGLSLMAFLMWSGFTEKMSEYIIAWADSVVIWLNGLLDWLMGVPAGLKLNSQLDQFLGRFFHYHIYLWTGYLTLLKPVLAPLLWYSSIVGVLGLSAQLCLLQDIISTLTLHIYCFYVYAARLYYFQVYGLSSLWRLFRGKKWNVLRRRVDSASYDVDQLFVGTLLFTILLFLLPTTALYYVVFLGLRLVVLILNGIVSKCVSIINSLPVHGVLLRLSHSPSITGDLMFTVLREQASDTTLFVAMQTTQLPYLKLVQVLGEESMKIDQRPTYTWGKLIKRMCVGELIYPWIEPAMDNGK